MKKSKKIPVTKMQQLQIAIDDLTLIAENHKNSLEELKRYTMFVNKILIEKGFFTEKVVEKDGQKVYVLERPNSTVPASQVCAQTVCTEKPAVACVEQLVPDVIPMVNGAN